MELATTARLLITCPDQPGIVAAVSNHLYNHGADINDLDQHSTDPGDDVFFLRLEFQTPHLDVSREALERSFEQAVARRYQMQWQIHYAAEPKRMTLLVSKFDHAMLELLWRWSRGDLAGKVVQVVSNHPDLKALVEGFDVPFHHIPVSVEQKEEAEHTLLDLLAAQQTELVVLARYMQILTPKVVDAYPNRVINIHHSFLPAFIGADPYSQAFERGVKLIGATAHYVTSELDQGPIIEQDVVRVSHRHEIRDLKALGRDLERTVLAHAVQWHLEDRLIVYGNKTIVFN